MSVPYIIGFSSLAGPKPRNEDFCGAVSPQGSELENKGLLAALADGVGGHPNAHQASEFVVRGLLADYYATPDTWGVFKSLDVVIQSLNRWLFSQNQATLITSAGMATTLSALLLRGDRYHFSHVGDSRIYLWRKGQLVRLTQDHVWDHPELKTVLSRAVGLDGLLSVDYGDGELSIGDRFLICSDGVWNPLGERHLNEVLRTVPEPQEAAEQLTRYALNAGGRDNCSAMIIRVDAIPPSRMRDSLLAASRLPVPERLKEGDEVDGIVIDGILHESRTALLYQAHVQSSGQKCVFKTLPPGADEAAGTALAHEEWLARRVVDPSFPQVIPAESRSYLYYLMSWHEGATLGSWLREGRHFSVADVANLGMCLLRGVAALHRLSVVHRDIKPDNLHLGADARLRILDLGTAVSEGHDHGEAGSPGTPSYMAPEVLEGSSATVSSDLYACGVTLYELLTRKFPYGEIEPFQKPKFGEPVSPSRYRGDIPAWLERIILKAVQPAPEERFETAEEFLLALEKGSHGQLQVPRRRPLVKRDPDLVLKISLAISLVTNVWLTYLLLVLE